jgi:glycosyltransferase involved in cell wall biosynthesis
VLLATYNGGNYLEEFLNSLVKQNGVMIHLLVSDDGSTDTTLNILEQFRSQFSSLKILKGPQLGPAANFFSLLKESKMEFVALADQDDVWKSDHLANSIERIQDIPGDYLPVLSISRVSEFNEHDQSAYIWPKHKLEVLFPGILYENIGRGCTMVLNRALVDTVNRSNKEDAIMHDWWILLIAWLHGKIVLSQAAEIDYRIHSGNLVGSPKLTIISLLKRAIVSRLGRPRHLQISSMHMQYSNRDACREGYDYLDDWFNKIHSKWYIRIRILCGKTKLRSNKGEDLLLKISIVLFRCNPSRPKCSVFKID